jgi:hypothetical protein
MFILKRCDTASPKKGIARNRIINPKIILTGKTIENILSWGTVLDKSPTPTSETRRAPKTGKDI